MWDNLTTEGRVAVILIAILALYALLNLTLGDGDGE